MKKLFSLGLLSLFVFSACGETVEATPQKLGKDSAAVLIEEFSDPQCPACAATSPEIEQIVKDNPDLARMEYYHFPLTAIHEYAFVAAEATECAADQGKFWEYLNMIFATQSSLNEDHIYKVADSLKLDRITFDECLDSRKHKRKIQAHMAKGASRQVGYTPSVFVNGELVRYSGAEQFKAYLESVR